MMTPIQEAYEDGTCPDCGEPIPDSAVEGDECVECGHVFYEIHANDDELPHDEHGNFDPLGNF